ncbi:hypothetical protein [Ottowia sp.]|uniref:hypothetical protein n=1 Tax=Ottowia sp. TaxID=1898956 RepID=UPI0025F56B17|nr:hypothetical protein [Ottowia sp.]
MAVKISGVKPTITCPATLYLPGDGGAFVIHNFEVLFKRLTADERDRLHEQFTVGTTVGESAAASDGAPAPAPKRLSNAELLDQIVQGWGGMFDEHGAAVPYSHEERKATEQAFPGLEQAMVVSWYDNLFVHQREAARKNSQAPSVTTSAETTRAAT